MNAREDLHLGPAVPAQVAAAEPPATLEDGRVISAMQEYLAELEAGRRPDRRKFLAGHPEIAVVLEDCLDGLEFMRAAAPRLQADHQVASTTSPAIEPESSLGDFRIVGEIGRGGMGVVYEALQISLGRRVALKVLPFAAALDPKQLQRFKNEAQAAAHLHHTNIVPVFGVGCERGVHYYAMQFIEGQTLAAVIGELRQQIGLDKASPSKALSQIASDLVSGRFGPVRQARSEGPSTVTYERHEPAPAPAGETIPRVIPSTEPSIKSAAYLRSVANLGIQTAEALEHAHQLGVVHRDIKPANLLVDGRGNLWITDFGLAHCQNQAGLTMTGDLIGTLRYMSPEQALAKRPLIDHRTDIYSLGVTLYELLTLEPAFSGSDREELLQQIAFEEPRPARQRNKAIPRELETIVLKAMDKNPEGRYATAQELADDLRRFLEDQPIKAKRPTHLQRAVKWGRRHKAVVRAAAVVLGLAALGLVVSTLLIGRAQQRTQKEQWMREYVIPKIRGFVAEKNYRAAFDLAAIAEQVIADDPTLAELRPMFTSFWTVLTDPAGADVYAKPYDRPQEDWTFLGRSPLDLRLPQGFFRWKVTKEGFPDVQGFRDAVEGRIQFALDKEGSAPPGMVRVSGNAYRENSDNVKDPNALDLEDYFIDRCEVTNRQFKEFMDHGGYPERKYWKHFPNEQTALPFLYASTAGLLESPLGQGAWLAAGALLPGRTEHMVRSWEVTIAAFQDQTGMPGPSTWRSGTYPAGEADYPVRGVSWYEAAAYAEFARKSLPTVAHWLRASGQQHAGDITPLSNFEHSGPAPVGKYPGQGPFGTLDMAGNVKEWCWNRSEGDRRFILGGAWNEPAYLFQFRETAPSLDRLPVNGFRCVRYLSEKIPPAALKDMHAGHRDYENERPVSDELFQFFKTLYAYDKAPLNAQTESKEESAEAVHETITFDAAYGKERVIAHLYLPRNGKPPYQTVVFFPWNVFFQNKSFPRENPPEAIASIFRSGRAVLWPLYNGSYERQGQKPTSWSEWRLLVIHWYQDLARSVDYLQERSDIDRDKLAYIGVSTYYAGVINVALEDRFKVAVLKDFGLPPDRKPLPEVEPINFAPRVHAPVLMINGRNDALLPYETSQRPLYRLLGTPQKDKRHLVYDLTGHGVPLAKFEKEMLSWLDQYLGEVR